MWIHVQIYLTLSEMFDFIITGLKFKELLKIRYFMRVPEVQQKYLSETFRGIVSCKSFNPIVFLIPKVSYARDNRSVKATIDGR